MCKESFKGHSFATVVVTVPAHLPEIREAVHQGDWKKVVGRDEFDRLLDCFAVRVVSCPSGRMMWVLERNPVAFELPYVVEFATLNEQESVKLRGQVVSQEWYLLGQRDLRVKDLALRLHYFLRELFSRREQNA